MIIKPIELSKEQRASRAVRLSWLVKHEGWSDFIDLVNEQEERIIGEIVNCKPEELQEKKGELKHNRYLLNLVGRTIEGDYK